MRTRTLVVMAAIGAAGIVSSIAQTVYSVNAVGFVNISLPQGFSLIANPLNGPSNNNNVNVVLPDAATPPVPDDTTLQKWNPATSSFAEQATFYQGAGWLDESLANPSPMVLNPGEGAFISLPSVKTITFVGEVPQGNLSLPIPTGFSIISQLTPQEIDVKTAGLPAADDDTAQFWNNAAGGYFPPSTCYGGDWYDADLNPTTPPTPKIGEAFFFFRNPANLTNVWTRTFNVSP